MGKLISIDNGGTLTDFLVVDGSTIHRTKVLTTPYDLSRCFFEGLKKVSREIYGEERVADLLQATDLIRYSTTQGTNALVERKGPRIGLLLAAGETPDFLLEGDNAKQLFESIVGDRIGTVDLELEGEAGELELVRAVNDLSTRGASRIVVALRGAGSSEIEARLKRILLRRFPRHLLGALPVLFSQEVADDPDDARRTWTALFNSFLHPAMEQFLYNVEQDLRESALRTPLLIFRNDGDSARVAKTIAIKTYSSGPRGGLEGSRALADHYGMRHLVTLDVGGTSSDVGVVENGVVRAGHRGLVENVACSFPLCDIVSFGVGGSSVIRAEASRLRVGPESVGSEPGPACFGLGGKKATITDAFLVQGVIDPSTFFGGELRLDSDRAKAAIMENVAGPLGLDLTDALFAMEDAWVDEIASGLRDRVTPGSSATLAAFGGAGPLVATEIADRLGVHRVLIPGLAAVHSAFGIGFSDIGHRYETRLSKADAAGLAAAHNVLVERARRDMFAEGTELADCRIEAHLVVPGDGGEEIALLDAPDALPEGLTGRSDLTLTLRVVRPVSHVKLAEASDPPAVDALSTGSRALQRRGGGVDEVPLHAFGAQPPGANGTGLAILEEEFFTCRIGEGWRFDFTANRDVLLTRMGA